MFPHELTPEQRAAWEAWFRTVAMQVVQQDAALDPSVTETCRQMTSEMSAFIDGYFRRKSST